MQIHILIQENFDAMLLFMFAFNLPQRVNCNAGISTWSFILWSDTRLQRADDSIDAMKCVDSVQAREEHGSN